MLSQIKPNIQTRVAVIIVHRHAFPFEILEAIDTVSHDEIVFAVLLANIIKPANVRVIQRRDVPSLPSEPRFLRVPNPHRSPWKLRHR